MFQSASLLSIARRSETIKKGGWLQQKNWQKIG